MTEAGGELTCEDEFVVGGAGDLGDVAAGVGETGRSGE